MLTATLRAVFYGGPHDGHQAALEQLARMVWLAHPAAPNDPARDLCYELVSQDGAECRYEYRTVSLAPKSA